MTATRTAASAHAAVDAAHLAVEQSRKVVALSPHSAVLAQYGGCRQDAAFGKLAQQVVVDVGLPAHWRGCVQGRGKKFRPNPATRQ